MNRKPLAAHLCRTYCTSQSASKACKRRVACIVRERGRAHLPLKIATSVVRYAPKHLQDVVPGRVRV